jgi:fermentation-respiration switch protein FrsA (DUF1100 family)
MKVFSTVVGLALVALGVLWFGQRRLIYFPDSVVPPPKAVSLEAAERVAFFTPDDLRLEGWFVRPTAPPTGQTILVFNGNGGNRAYRAPLAAALAAEGHAVLLFDYRGYGGNPGLPSEQGLRLDARGALAAVLGHDAVDPSRIVYFGESLGTALAVWLAGEHRPQALILRSPFPSLAEVGAHHYPFIPVRWLLRDRFETTSRLPTSGVPLLVVRGDADSIVLPEMSEAVYEAASEPKWLATIEHADHNSAALLHGREMMAAISRFLASVRQ